MSARRLEVSLGRRSYELLIEPGLLDQAGRILRPRLKAPRIVLVTDRHVETAGHVSQLLRSLLASDIATEVIIVPTGELSKSMPQLEALCDRILALGIDRGTTIAALGGGVVGDLAGFAAAILMRGLDLIQMPTTLLAQVDSSVGGKTGVNSRHGKNLIGAFHQPLCVLIDPAVLASLPRRELLAGYAELVKHALIRDAGLFAWLEASASSIVGSPEHPCSADFQAQAIARSVAVKAAIVAADERESGERALLNLGHTFAHAYETLDGYSQRLLHGEAVSIGICDALRLSHRLELCNADAGDRATKHLARLGLPTRLADRRLAFRPEDVLAAMRKDKKSRAGRLSFVLCRGIGAAELVQDVQESAVIACLAHAAGPVS